MNKVIVTGRVTHDPKKVVYDRQKDLSFVKLGVAVHDKGKTIYVDFKIFDQKLVDQVATYITKGRTVEVEGHIETYKEALEFVAENVIFGSDKAEEILRHQDKINDFENTF